MREIDPDIPVPSDTVVEVVAGVMEGSLTAVTTKHVPRIRAFEIQEAELFRPVRRVLVHARGCAAAKIVRIAQEHDIEVVLVQSDPDMDSVAADLLTDEDELVCIGGSTPDESYLNARSVLTIAEQFSVDSLHPGIGFLSENSNFAGLTRTHGINFIGPPVKAMETMGE